STCSVPVALGSSKRTSTITPSPTRQRRSPAPANVIKTRWCIAFMFLPTLQVSREHSGGGGSHPVTMLEKAESVHRNAAVLVGSTGWLLLRLVTVNHNDVGDDYSFVFQSAGEQFQRSRRI